MRKSSIGILLPIILSLQASFAQPNLTFKRIEVNYPEVRLAFSVTCGGQIRYDLGPQHFEVRENGLLVKDATIWCPDNDDCCISAVLVFDRSSSMLGVKLDREKLGGLAFVDQMNTGGTICDEAAVVSFREYVTLDQGMTNDKQMLRAAINALQSAGRTAVWDAAKFGVDHLLSYGRNRCRAVILLTDGGDNSSAWNNVRSVIDYALSNGVKVFTIGFGITPGSREEQDLADLAGGTGGRFYLTQDGTDLARIYSEIKEAVKEEYRECYITYRTNCPDGKRRMVDLTIRDFCNGSDTRTRYYTAPYDPSQFQSVTLRVGSGTVIGTKEILIPVYLQTPVDAVFGKCSFTLGIDKTVCDLVGVSTAGTLLDSIPVTFVDVGSGYTIYTHKEKYIKGDGILLYLKFVGADVDVRSASWLKISGWNFEAYCLKAVPLLGELWVEPRVPLLECDLTVPPLVVWNDERKEYEPNPFSAVAVVRNRGDREARNVFATITLSSPSIALSSPKAWSQRVTPTTIYPGVEGTVAWSLESLRSAIQDSVEICFLITSDNHPEIRCCRTVTLTPFQSAALSCRLAAPDTIYFREQYYEPEEFDIRITAANNGTGLTRDLVGQLLQDTRFTIIPPASALLSPLFLPKDTAEATFRVRVHPRTTDGYDTVRVHLQGNDTDPVWCEYPIWVQRERSPRFTLQCAATPDSLSFDERSGDYAPNPFPVRTTAVNVGETYAEDCQLMFVGPPRFTPVGTNLRPEGTMSVGDARTESWLVRALPRSVGGWDTLHFQVLGRGGLGKKIVVAECFVPVYVPAVRHPRYAISCALPSELKYLQNGYTPDPFAFSATIRNTGDATGWDVDAAALIPQSLTLVSGSPPRIRIPEIRPGDSVSVSWNLSAAFRTQDESLRVCIQAVDPAGGHAECCRTILIPKVEPPAIGVSCSTIDTLQIDPATGMYRSNPFPVYLTIHNGGNGMAETVRATVSVRGSYVQVQDSLTRFIGNIPAGGTEMVTWNLLAVKRPSSDLLPIDLRVESANHPVRDCRLEVFIPALQDPDLSVTCSSAPDDTLHFDWSTGDFLPREFTVEGLVRNTGRIEARGVRATLILPSSVMLADGETGSHAVTPSDLPPGGTGTVRWKLRARRQDEGALREFLILVRGDNTREATCTDPLFIQGAPRRVTLTLPKDVLLAFGQKVTIPLAIDRTVGKEITRYMLDLLYDPALITFLGVSHAGTVTEGTWVGPQSEPVSPGRVRVTNYTTSRALSAEEGTLLNFLFQGTFDSTGQLPRSASGPLRVDSQTVVFNDGMVGVLTREGSVITTNRCLSPLVAGEGYRLEQNRPNPFNPQTSISFTVPEPVFVSLVVLDRMGREVAVLVHRLMENGSYTIPFEAPSLPSDIYFYRLSASGNAGLRYQSVRKMILTR